MIDYRELLIKYLMVVIDAEGVDFLHYGDWTDEEKPVLQELAAEADKRILESRKGRP